MKLTMESTGNTEADPTPNGGGARFLASLPGRYRPDPHTITRLAAKADVLLANGYSGGELLRRLTAGIDSAHDPAKALVQRLENLPVPKGISAPEKPPWCGECDERTRQRETPDDKVERCARCHPQRAVVPPAAS